MSFGVVVAAVGDVAAALREERLVIVRAANLDLDAQVTLTASLGTLVGTRHGVPQVRYEDDRVADGRAFFNEQWHADLSWSREGPVVTVLSGVDIAAAVAPTTFVDTVSAFARLTEGEQAEARTWSACHHVERSRTERYGTGASPRRRLRWRRGLVRAPIGWRAGVAVPTFVPSPGAVHPVVVTHEATGRDGVTLGDHAWTLAGLADGGGRLLVDGFQRRLVELGDHHVHEWRYGDVVVFDNRTLLHRREPGRHPGEPRVLRRTAAWPKGS